MSQIRCYEGPAPSTPPAGVVTLYAKTDGRWYFKADDGVETPLKPVGAGTGDLLADGTVPLSANWNAVLSITGYQWTSTATTGTAPFVVASTTLVANLNADLLDGNEATAFATAAQGTLADSALQNLVDDTTPQLGATLDANTFDIDMGINVVTDTKVGQWDLAYGWGDHSLIGYITGVQDDATPLLGGDLDMNGNDIITSAGADINLLPSGTGDVRIGNLVFDGDQTVGAGQDNYVLTYDNATGLVALEASTGGGTGGYTPQFKTAAYTASTGDKVFVDCSGGAVTITLPATPSSGNEVIVQDSSGDAATNNVTVARNGETIDSTAADFVIDLNYGSCAFAYNGTTWVISPVNGVA